MAWDLDVTNYSEHELIELFGIKSTDNEKARISILFEAYKKVLNDKSKSKYETDEFEAFIFDVSKKLGLDDSNLHKMVTNEEHDLIAKDKAFARNNSIIQQDSHFLISNKSSALAFKEMQTGRSADEARHPPGTINPNKVHSLYKAINVDSRFRDNYYTTKSGDFHITLPTRITDVVKIQMGNFTLPLTMYGFSEIQGNTTFVITTNPTTSPVRYVITIPDGNYKSPFSGHPSLVSIEDIINTQLAAAGINPTTDLFFNIDHISGKSVFAVPSGSTVNTFKVEFACGSDGVILTDDNLQLRLGWILGFRSGTYIGGPGSGGSAAIVSEGMCIPFIPRYLFLAVDDYQASGVSNYFNSGFQSSLLPSNILTRIDIGNLIEGSGSFTLGDALTYTTTAVNNSRSYFGPVILEKLRFTLYDEYGRIIDLNNMDWSVSLSLECIYEQT